MGLHVVCGAGVAFLCHIVCWVSYRWELGAELESAALQAEREIPFRMWGVLSCFVFLEPTGSLRSYMYCRLCVLEPISWGSMLCDLASVT